MRREVEVEGGRRRETDRDLLELCVP